MIYSVLSGYGPSVEPVYDDRSTAMIIMVIVICVLAVLCIIFLYLWLENRHSKKGKELVNNTIQTLNSKAHKD